MKRLIIPTAMLSLFTFIVPVTALARDAGKPAMSISVLKKSGPHQISSKKGKDFITFYLRITGLTMDTKIGGKNVTGRGHVQMYLGKIPSDAYRKRDLHNIASYSAPAKVGKSRYAVSIEFNNPWIKRHRGKHVLMIGLARNDEIMYPVKAVSFSLQVK